MTDQTANGPTEPRVADHLPAGPDNDQESPVERSESQHPPVVSTTDPEAQTDDPLIDPTNS